MTDSAEHDGWNPPGPGPWRQDRAHLPAAVTPLLQEMYPAGFAAGFAAALEPFGVLLDTMRLEYVNGFSYMQPRSVRRSRAGRPEVARAARRRDRASHRVGAAGVRANASGVRGSGSGTRSASRRRSRAISELADVDLGALDDEGLRRPPARVHRAPRCDVASASPLQRDGDAAGRRLHPPCRCGGPASSPYRCSRCSTAGHRCRGSCHPSWCRRSVRCESDPDARALLTSDAPADERLAELCDRIPEVDDYLRSAGYRLAAGFDLTNPTIGERPDVVLDRIRACLDHDRDAAGRARRADGGRAPRRRSRPTSSELVRRPARRGATGLPAA